MILHVTVAALLVAFTELFLWQLRRATSGNELSWAYVVEWPIFAGYAIYMWWTLVHEPTAEPASARSVRPDNGPSGSVGAKSLPIEDGPVGAPSAGVGDTDGADAELAAYNRYLAELNESGRPKRW